MKIIYKSKFKEQDNSLSELTDPSIPEKIQKFLIENPFPKDHSGIHKFAEEELGIEADLLEQYIYAMLCTVLIGGKSKGDTSKITKEQLNIGLQIEYEHVNLDKKYENNKVIKAIQELYQTKISADHYIENNRYYTTKTDFQSELEKEG